MGIYSNNRSGAMGVAQVRANMSYGPTDIGRIMYEAACNDQAMFEAVLLSDMRELKGLSEGTILQSEVAALNEASLKEYAAKAREILKSLWAKLKGVFKTAIQNISAYILRDGKAFADKYREASKKFKTSGTVTGCTIRNTDFDVIIPPQASLEKYILRDADRYKEDGKQKVIAKMLSTSCGESGGEMTPKQFQAKVIEKGFKTNQDVKSTDSAAINRMLDVISNAKTSIKNLNTKEREAEKAIKAAGDSIKKVERDAGNADAVKTIGMLVSACQVVLSTTTSASIKLIKTDVSSSRKILGKLMAECMHESAVMVEAAGEAGADEVEAALDDTVEHDYDPEVDEFIAANTDDAV